MVLVTLLLASTFAAGATLYGDSLDADEAMPPSPETATAGTESDGNWLGSPGDLFRLSNDEAGASDVAVRVNFTIEEGSSTVGNSLNSVYIEVTTDSPDMFSGTSEDDLTTIGVDTDNDGDIEEDIADDVDEWSVGNDGTALKIGLSGSAYTAQAGHSIIVTFGGVENPASAGTYDLEAQTSGDGNWHYGNVSVSD